LVVIAIIGVLAALSASAFVRFIGVQQQSNTELMILKIKRTLDRQWRAVVDNSRLDGKTNKIPPDVLRLAGNDPLRAQVIWTKLKLRQQFPMNFVEALNAPSIPSYPGASLSPPSSYGKAIGQYSQANNDATTQSAACLLVILTTKAGRGMDLDVENLSNLEVADTDGDGVPELVDGWGRPLRFYRWPTGNTELNLANPSDPGNSAAYQSKLLRDPEDSTGLLMQWDGANGWWGPATNPTYRSVFEQLCHSLSTGSPPVPQSYYMEPVIASAGADGKWGLVTPDPVPPGLSMSPITSPTDPEYGKDKDNIYSYRLTRR
jgi:hypothetical protein